jgi:hypothetical protein
MKNKSWHLNRRTFLRSAGVCMALPWLEAMSAGKASSPVKKRFFAGYFAYGVPMPADSDPQRLTNGWFPVGTGKDYKLPNMHKAMEPLRDKVTFLSGLSHPQGASPSHKACDSYLTGANIRQSYEKQSISIDQYLAEKLGNETRYKSLVYSTLGGVNRPYRTATLSFNRNGRPIPALNKPQEIFRRLFGVVSQAEKNALVSRGSIIDTVLGEAKSMDRRLGKNDKAKMDEYLNSVREVELLTEREVSWLKKPKPRVSTDGLQLDVDASEPEAYLTAMYSLVALAFQTDSSRFITYQGTPEEAAYTDSFPKAVGLTDSAHKLSHEKKDYTKVAKYIGFQNEMYYNFLKKLDSIQEGDSTLLDNTVSLYGCTTSKTHQAVNFPMTLSGGRNMGFNHGQHQAFKKENFSNLFVTIANQMGVETEKFADSDGELTRLLG